VIVVARPRSEAALLSRPPRESWTEEGVDIRIEGRYDSFSTLLLRMPIAVWNLLPEHQAYSFVGFVTSENLAVYQIPSSRGMQNFLKCKTLELLRILTTAIDQESNTEAKTCPLGDEPLAESWDPDGPTA
jgi:hypothetical protein